VSGPDSDSAVGTSGSNPIHIKETYMPGANRELAARLGKFLVVGSTGVMVNNAALYAFYQQLRLPLVTASTLAVTLAIANNFVLNDRWTFSERHQSAWLRRFAQFSLASLGGLALATLTLWLLVTFLDVQYVIANTVGIAIGTGSNLVTSMTWTWARSGEQ
jgi:dolichol-phosphate mannosyltransferase